jgi:hypothetical protein
MTKEKTRKIAHKLAELFLMERPAFDRLNGVPPLLSINPWFFGFPHRISRDSNDFFFAPEVMEECCSYGRADTLLFMSANAILYAWGMYQRSMDHIHKGTRTFK